MNELAKRLHNLAPDQVRLGLADDSSLELSVHSTEFFGEQFQAEGSTCGRTYRLVSDGTTDPLVVGRRVEDGWEMVGEVSTVERLD